MFTKMHIHLQTPQMPFSVGAVQQVHRGFLRDSHILRTHVLRPTGTQIIASNAQANLQFLEHSYHK